MSENNEGACACNCLSPALPQRPCELTTMKSPHGILNFESAKKFGNIFLFFKKNVASHYEFVLHLGCVYKHLKLHIYLFF